MYDYDYEIEWLQLLHCLKYLQMFQPLQFQTAVNVLGQLEGEDVYEALEAVSECLFDSEAGDYDEELGIESVTVTSDAINRYLAAGMELCLMRRNGNFSVYLDKVHNAVEWYLWNGTDCLCDYEVHTCTARAEIRLYLSPDCFEIGIFADQTVEFLLFFRRETERLERLIRRQSDTPAHGEEKQEREEVS